MGIKLTDPSNPERKTGVWYKHLYAQVLIAIMAGIALGYFAPSVGTAMKPLGDAFIRLVKMVIAPVIFLTVVTGIAGMRELSGVGRVAARAFVYFITVSTFALFIGLVVANLVKPGHGMNIDPTSIDDAGVADYVQKAHDSSITGFLTDIIPTTLVAAVADGHILQVLFVAILFGVSLTMIGEKARPLIELFDAATHAVFKLVSILMHAAPIGAFGAMAFMIGTYGVGTLTNLMGLVLTFYATSLLFVLVVLGLIARAAGFRILRLIAYLKSELLLVLGTSSSETALPSLIEKMERAGCEKSVVGLVVPTGYSFNLDGTNIYMTLAALFVAQALNIELAFQDQIALLLVAMISSKGAAGVTGAGFITLAATLSIVPTVPVAGMALILGIDRFMSECRSLTNFIGNAVATIVVSAWEGKLDRSRLNAAMAGIPLPPTSDVEAIIED